MSDTCDKPNVGGIVVGTMIATLAVVAVVLIIIYFIFRKRKSDSAQKHLELIDEHKLNHTDFEGHTSHPGRNLDKSNDNLTKIDGFANLGFVQETDINFVEKGFGGYVPCKEYRSSKREKWLKNIVDEPTAAGAPPDESQNKPETPAVGAPTEETVSSSSPAAGAGAPGRALLPRNWVSFPATKTLDSESEQSQSPNKLGSRQSLDDSFFPQVPKTVAVPLRSGDVTGLGFNVQGSMRDGIFVSQIHDKGPAAESGHINQGDRIMKVSISFENMVYQDALTILSYASPYAVSIEIQKEDSLAGGKNRKKTSSLEKLYYPLCKSQSMDDLRKIGKAPSKEAVDQGSKSGSKTGSDSALSSTNDPSPTNSNSKLPETTTTAIISNDSLVKDVSEALKASTTAAEDGSASTAKAPVVDDKPSTENINDENRSSDAGMAESKTNEINPPLSLNPQPPHKPLVNGEIIEDDRPPLDVKMVDDAAKTSQPSSNDSSSPQHDDKTRKHDLGYFTLPADSSISLQTNGLSHDEESLSRNPPITSTSASQKEQLTVSVTNDNGHESESSDLGTLSSQEVSPKDEITTSTVNGPTILTNETVEVA